MEKRDITIQLKLNPSKGKKNNVQFTVTSESFVEMLHVGSILHKTNNEHA